MSHRTELGLALLLAVALTVALLAGRRHPRATEPYEPVSTYFSGPTGGRGPYDVLARLGVPVERRRTTLFDLARQARRRPAVLMVVAPSRWLASAELEAVAHYIAAGGALVAVGDAGGLTQCLGWDTATPDSAGIAGRDSAAVAVPAGLARLPGVRWVMQSVAQDTLEGDTKRAAELRKLGRPGGLIREEGECDSTTLVATDTLLATVQGDPVVIRLHYRGGGRALLVSEDDYFRNRAWRDTDVPGLLVPLIVPETRGRVSWDEYHHGHGAEGSLTRAALAWMARSPIGWVLWQLVAVALVWLVVTAVRFGPPRSVIDRRRRSPLEHLEALAAGLEGAAGVETAVALTVSGLRRRLSRTGQLPRGDARQWLGALELALPGARGRRAARRLQDMLTKPGGSERVLGAAQAVEDVWEELRPRAKPAAS
ncbi:MAG TPA: DUF4350 domain-containing protein [Gemmatimonadales bacterium]|jgi:hypothetical protein